MKHVGVLTSGGDAPGMNPALRGAVRQALAAGARVTAVMEGYAGLLLGGRHLRACGWDDVSNVLHLGGTVFGSARSEGFRFEAGRRKAVANLVHAGLDRLVVIGGDGSLTGADRLRAEWSSHLAALVASGEITAGQARAHPTLHLVGLVGSIDNDLWGTDMTIGCDSALHRVVDAVDTLTSTAMSHQRSFVVEVMGRACGYLALAAAACTDADYVLIPEAPPEDWRADLCDALAAATAAGRRKRIVILAEGAADRQGTPIRADEVREVIERQLGLETRVTVLGHVQRGGSPSAYDRVMSTVLGARAADVLLAMGPGDGPVLLGTAGPEVVRRPLMHCVEKTHAVAQAIRDGRFDEAVDGRGEEFTELLPLVRVLTAIHPPVATGPRLLVAHVGAPAPGMNAAVHAFAQVCAARGIQPLAAHDGLRGGVVDGRIEPLLAEQVEGIGSLGATVLGTSRWWPHHPGRVEAARQALFRHAVDGVVLVGGFEALEAATTLGVPCAVVPATISNNVPGTDVSVGCDTALNAIIEAVDRLKQSAVGSRDRVFVVEVMGRRCGYLAVMAGIGAGAELVYTHEDGLDLARLGRDLQRLNGAFDQGRNVGIVLLADGASDAWDAQALARVLDAEGGERFDTRVCVLGHLQQGGRPSPRDRLVGARLAEAAVGAVTSRSDAVLVGLTGSEVQLRPAAELLARADRANRRPDRPVTEGILEGLRAMMLR